jgi:TP901 family phage tail tape measure protein
MFELGARINSSFGRAFENAQNQLEATSGQAEEANTMFSKMGAGLGTAAVGIGAAALAAGGLAVSVGDDLQKSLNGVQASTGVADEAMADMKDTMLAIYNNNFGENFAEIGTAMGLVTQQTGLTGAALQKMTEGAFALRDTFEMDVAGSVETAGVMMKNFGVDSNQAYNLIVQGAQKGLNKQGDLLDILKEYGPHFASLGFSAEEAMNMLVNGAEGGVFSVDNLGDVVHEFGRMMREEDVSGPLQELGLDTEKYTGMVAKGGETAKQAFGEIAKKIAAIEDPVKQNQIGIGVFGDMMGEVGIKGVLAMANTKGAIDKTKDALGAINKVKYNTFGEAMTGIKRNLETGILLPLGDKILPKLNQLAGWITTNMPAIQNEIEYAFDTAGDAIGAVGTKIQETKTFFQDHWNVVAPILAGIGAGAITFGAITLATKAWTTATELATGAQKALNFVMNLSPMGKAVAIVSLLVAGGVALYQNWDLVKTKAGELWEGIKSVFSDVAGWFDANVIQPILGIMPNWLSNLFSGGASATVTVTGDYGEEPGNNAKGTDNWRGGLTWVGELGPELVNLPKGAQVFNHNKSMEMANGGRVSNLESKLSGVNNNSSFAPVFSPQIIVQGNADEGTVARVMKMSFAEFKSFMKQYESDKRRLQFSPS